MMKTRGLTTALAIVALLSMAMTAQATIVLDSWKIDLSAIPGMGAFGNIADIDEIEFLGISHSVIDDVNGNFFPDPGDTLEVDGALVGTSMTGGGFPRIVTTTSKILNVDFEITMTFEVDGVITSVDPVAGIINLQHLAAAGDRGELNIYVDDLTDAFGLQGNTELNPGNGVGGSGIVDGVLVATFDVRAGDGGAIDAFMGTDGFDPTLDGFDDATFDFVSGLSGVLFDKNGNDLTLGVLGDQFLVMTDSNFDMDPDGDGAINSGPPTGWASTGFTNQGGGGSIFDHYVREDGSAVFGVPEPGSVVVWSLLLVVAGSLGFYRRKK